jgi:hypothetical protein
MSDNNGKDDNVTEINPKGGDKRSPAERLLDGVKKQKREALENKMKEKLKIVLEQKEAYEGTLVEISALEEEIKAVDKIKL